MTRIPLVLVAAVADNGVIGKDGTMPWHHRSDLERFKALTMGHPVVMGRKTFHAIGRPLPGRTSIVVTRDPAFTAAGVVATPNLPVALAVARGDALRRGAFAIMLIGGGSLYAEAMYIADRLEITRIHMRPEGDTVFPEIESAVWRETARIDHEKGPQDDAAFTCCTYERIPRLRG
ncbi:Dihydrofolate reductase [Rhodovulum sp. PH10]|uniref:dihydrofolate reductase n=1 Tax=Rhodovulum sp. PH10 TaxID=1187851 RepID=UPI00027C2945|nr:dihydrofolate reductase [Rhodovulum sp. PH10]EJW11209.1 Dihydrofolate reductase [Rhodovulum sp. PH10]